MRAIVLVGGQGTRLRSVVSDVPKVMAPIGGRPFLCLLLDLLERQGVSEVILAAGYLAESLTGTLGERYRGLRLRYAIESEPLGTGGALRHALSLVDRFPVFALNGDTYLDLDYAAMRRAHEAAGADLTMALRHSEESARYGCAKIAKGRVVGFDAAGARAAGTISAGVYLFARPLLDDPSLPMSFSFEKDFLELRAAVLRPLAFVTDGYFIDIGIPEDYRRAERELTRR